MKKNDSMSIKIITEHHHKPFRQLSPVSHILPLYLEFYLLSGGKFDFIFIVE